MLHIMYVASIMSMAGAQLLYCQFFSSS